MSLDRIQALESKVAAQAAYIDELHEYLFADVTADKSGFVSGIDEVVDNSGDDIATAIGGHKEKRPPKPSKPNWGSA